MDPDALVTPVCARCGYALTGLPAAGACPECGRPFGGDEISLYGYAAGINATHFTRRPATRGQLAFQWAWSVPVLALCAMLFARTPVRFVHLPLTVGLGLAIATWRSVRPADRGADGVAPPQGAVQVRLTPAGVRQVTRSAGPIPFEDVDGPRIGWTQVKAVRLAHRPDGWVRLTLSNDPPWWKLRVDHVDVVVRCTPQQAADLRDRIARWRVAVDNRPSQI